MSLVVDPGQDGAGGLSRFHHATQDGVQSKTYELAFPGGTVVKNPPANAGDTGWSPGPGRSHMPQNN